MVAVGGALATVVNFQRRGEQPAAPTMAMSQLRGHIDREFQDMFNWREECGLKHRMDNCLRQREGQYDPAVLQAIAQLGGSEVFARLTTNKIRGGAALMRSIFIQGDRPWEIRPTPVPTLPDDIKAGIQEIVKGEVQTMAQMGQMPDRAAVKRRIEQLAKAAQIAAKKQAKEQAEQATQYIDDILVEGDFYAALDQFILDFCTFPFAALRGPLASMRTTVGYVNGQPQRVRKAVLGFDRVDPYDLFWSRGASDIANADVIERKRLTRSDLNRLIGLPGYDENAIRSVIRDYGMSGFRYHQFQEAVRDRVENRESVINQVPEFDVLAYNGRLLGREINEYEIPIPDDLEIDDDLDYLVQAWVCGEYVLKAQIDPDPSNRVCYYTAAYEPISGSIAGTSLPELIADIQEVYNATLRALVNNIAFASGPQVAVNQTRWRSNGSGAVKLTPWQIWFHDSDPTANAAEKAIDFFQPNLNAQEIINVLLFLQNMADEISGIPRYLTGNDRLGGAGRTSSGLSMLMGNANRTMMSVASNIDMRVIVPCLKKTYDLVRLTTGTEVLRGDETIAPRGATYAEMREQDRMRQIEFLQATANPFDMEIIGAEGRAKLLRTIADNFADGEDVVPSNDELRQRMQARAQAAAMQPQGQGGTDPQSGQPGQPGQQGERAGASNPPKPSPDRATSQRLAGPTDNANRTRSPAAIARQPGK